MSTLKVPITDFSQEKSSLRWNIDDASTDPQITALYNALDVISIGSLNDAFKVDEVAKDSGTATPPADPFAQREMKWLVSYSDNVTGISYRLEIPCANLDELVVGTDILDVGVGSNGETFKAAFEAIVLSPDGNAVTMVSAKFVGRNL